MFTGVAAFQMNLATSWPRSSAPPSRALFRGSGSRSRERHRLIRTALDRMDFEWEDRFRDLGLTMKPSDYWRRQCKATFQFDRIGTKLVEDMGDETIMWGLRLSHTDGVWPESSKYIEEQFGHLPADVVRKIRARTRGSSTA